MTITSTSIRFGNNEEVVLGWTSNNGLIRLSTQSGLTFVFKQQGPDRICLMFGAQPATQTPPATLAPLRCFEKKAAGPAT